MFRVSAVVGAVLLAVAFVVGVGTSQDKKVAPKGQLPPNWKKLDLTKEQITKIYDAQTKFKAKIKSLEDQIAELKSEMKTAEINVLSDKQKELLRKITAGEVKKDEKKKPPEKDKN